MNFRFTWILFGILFVSVLGLLLSSLIDDKPSSSASVLESLEGLDPELVEKLTIERTEPTSESLSFVRTGKQSWSMTAPTAARVDGFTVNAVVAAIVKLKPTLAANISTLTVHGLDKPTLKVTLTSKGGATGTLNLGDTTLGNERAITFVTTDTRPSRVIAVKRSDLDVLFRANTSSEGGKAHAMAKWISDYRLKRLFTGEGDLVTNGESIKMSKAGKESVLVRSGTTGDWSFTAPTGYGAADTAGDPAATADAITGVRPLVNVLTGLQAFDASDFIEQPQPLDNYGLRPEDPNCVKLDVKNKDVLDVVYIGKSVEGASDKVYVKRADESVVMKASLTKERLAALAKVAADPLDLRDRTLISDLKKEQIDAIDITFRNGTTKLRKVPSGSESRWALYGGPSDPQLANPYVAELLTNLTKSRLAKEALTAPFDAMFADTEKQSEYKIWIEGCEKPEPPKDAKDANALPTEPKFKGDGKPTFTLIFGKAEGDLVYVRRIKADGSTSDFKIPTTILASVNRDRMSFLNATFNSFPTNTVRKLSFNRGAEQIELTNDGKGTADSPLGTWTYAKPEALKTTTPDGGKVMELLNYATSFSPVRAVVENPADTELATYGLGATPKMKVAVEVDAIEGKQKEFVYEIGNETEDKQFVYARQVGKSLVVLLPKLATDKFLTQNLTDRQLYKIDAATVKAFEIKGGKATNGGVPVAYRFEKVDGKWTVKAPDAKMTADAAKIDAFVTQLIAPRATEYVTGSTVDFGFSLENSPNAIEVRLECDGGLVLGWTFGNPADGGANVYAWCSVKPQEMLTMNALNLREVLNQPKALAK